MKRSSHQEHDYVFGQMMLSLRSDIGLTQAKLAEVLSVSRRSVADWESGHKYPKAEHLKHLIDLAFKNDAFHAEFQEAEIRILWKTAHQKTLLDERWLAALLSGKSMPTISSTEIENSLPLGWNPEKSPRLDWGDALSVPAFYGREWEINRLTEWVVPKRCRVVGVLGLGGIGKSALSVSLMHRIAEHFDVVIWRSLRNAPACDTLLDECLRVLEPQPTGQMLIGFEQRLNSLLGYMREQRILLVLDNLDTLLEEGENIGQMRSGFESYQKLLRRIAETNHQSCLLFTSREKPAVLAPLEGTHSPVSIIRLSRLEAKPCEQLLLEKDVIGSDSEYARLIDNYAGNPLALKIVAQMIVDLFGGEVAPFLNQGEIIFGSIRNLLDEQFDRLTVLEQSILLWLAILREPSTLNELLLLLVTPVSRSRLLEAIEALHRRSLIERGQKQGSFTLQSVVLEYATARLIAAVSDAIAEGNLAGLIEHGLELTQVREYVRQTQVRLIVAPILAYISSMYRDQSSVEQQLLTLLAQLTSIADNAQGYGPSNLVMLLGLLRGDLRGLDLSRLVLRSVYLQGMEMQDTRMVNATIHDGIFTENFDAMTSVAISGTGQYWAAASIRGEMRIWEAGGQLLRQTWLGHSDAIWALAFSPDGRILASGSSDGMHKLWDVASGNLLWWVRHTSYVNRLAFSPDGRILVTAGNDATIRLWDVTNRVLLETILYTKSPPVISWSPVGEFFATGDSEGQIQLWQVAENKSTRHIQTIKGHQDYIDGMAFAPDGHAFATSSWDGMVKVWEIPTGRLLHSLSGHTQWVARVAWSADGRIIASSSGDQTILLWDVETENYRAVLHGHTSGVYDLAFTPDNLHLLSGSRDGTLRVWDVSTEQCERIIQGYAASIYDVDWSPDGSQLVSGGLDKVLTIWDVAHNMPIQVLQKHVGIISGVGWSPNGRWLASSETEHAIRLWDLTSNNLDFQFLRPLDRGGNYTYTFAWSPDGEYLASGSHHGGIMIWNAMTRERVWISRQASVWFPNVAWSPDGALVVGGGNDGVLYIWNIAEDRLEQRLEGHHTLIKSLACSPNGMLLASGTSNMVGGELFVWDLHHGELLYSFTGHTGIVLSLAWDLSGELLFSGGAEGTLRCWNVQRGECIWVRQAHQGTVQTLRMSPDGNRIATCGDDGAIMIWDLQTGEYLQTLRRDRPYERLNITGINGLTEAQKANLRALGAIDANVT